MSNMEARNLDPLVLSAWQPIRARTIVREVAWARVAAGFLLAFAAGALLALGIKALGWWPGAAWEQDIVHIVHRTVNPVLDPIMLFLPLFGTNYSLAPVVAIAAIVFWRKRQYAVALHMAVVQAGSWILNPALKFTFPRPRPMLYELRGQYAFPAFPSGHSIAVVAVMLTAACLLYHYRKRSWGFWVVGSFFLLNSYSRIYLSVHWPTDLIGGTIIGAIWMTACWSGFRGAHGRVTHDA
jgi:membrane-associated phospholipid phosphatase